MWFNYHSCQSHGDSTMYLHTFEDNLSYIRDIAQYAQAFKCDICGKLFPIATTLHRHRSTCTDKTNHVLPGGFYSPQSDIFEDLEDVGICIPQEDRFYPYFATFDTESLLCFHSPTTERIATCSTPHISWSVSPSAGMFPDTRIPSAR